ncbi:MAG: 3-deoxy-7-phosphoheptulonate synthase [Candidatus Aminicenantes bacterium]|jgi:3-deoxy-7-phosphoheptulonate synthase|nr:3-deoxy-7-phosphoheptulonate synthase [Candidatus Aminicenantes bacterium]
MDDLKLSSLKNTNFKRTVVSVGEQNIGSGFTLIAGPCTVENKTQTLTIAHAVKKAGANILRGGAFKPRTSPYSFQGLGSEGLEILSQAREETGLPIVTEIMDTRHIAMVSEYADMFQIGSRNMQNFTLLKEVGKTDKPVLLKRGMNASLEEWINCAEYILSEGNPHVVLCERGIRTFETYTRNTLDLSIIPAVKEITHLPVIVDPSHATGRASLVERMCLAAVAAGSDGIMIEVHPNPKEALCDRDQLLTLAEFDGLVQKIQKMYRAMNDILAPSV